MQRQRRTVDDATKRKLAVEAEVHPDTIAKELRSPGLVRGMAGHRARAVLLKHGLLKVKEQKDADT